MRGKPAPCTPESGRHGSPPRVRGKLEERLDLRQQLRITPARAGKTSSQGRLSRRGEDHPRACGENVFPVMFSRSNCGSPPRVRGKRTDKQTQKPLKRITPARAGKTKNLTSLEQDEKDHPRACGENPQERLRIPGVPGSPPRVRGKLVPPSFSASRSWITPARAGKTLSRRSSKSSK